MMPRRCVLSVSRDEWSESWGRGSWRKRTPSHLRHPERRPAYRFCHHAPPDCLLRTDTARIAPKMIDPTSPLTFNPSLKFRFYPMRSECRTRIWALSLWLTVHCWKNSEELLIGFRRKNKLSLSQSRCKITILTDVQYAFVIFLFLFFSTLLFLL